ncbi:MAG: protein phosphatase 2C domain-containing protein [Bdellovibrionales bacterium]|nr:protein phosphatase 2C domain-containing protein [Bdellovibrionales bacterium]
MKSQLVQTTTATFLPTVSCFAYRGEERTIESSNYTVFNPTGRPGSLALAGSCAARASVGGQVACRLALEHFSRSLLDYYASHPEEESVDAEEPSGFHQRALETAFRDANQSVYSFGHSLAAGGRLGALFLALVLRDGCFVSGRVGGGSAYLFREGELYSFFETPTRTTVEDEENFLGSRSVVAVDIANVPAEPGDQVYVFSEGLTPSGENELASLLEEFTTDRVKNPVAQVCRFLFEAPSALGFGFGLYLGQNALFLPSSLQVPKEV